MMTATPKPTIHSINCYLATDGNYISADSPFTTTTNGPDGAVDTITLVDLLGHGTYKLTNTFNGLTIASSSGWEPQ